MGDKSFKTAYSMAFGKRRGVQQPVLRPSSPRRKNNPHPIQSYESGCHSNDGAEPKLSYSSPSNPSSCYNLQDFLIYNRLPDPPDTNIKKQITNAIVNHRSKSAAPAVAKEQIVGAPDSNSQHWIEWPRKSPGLIKIRPTLGPGPPRPHTTVGSHIRGEFVKEVPQEPQPTTKVQKKMSARPPSYVEQAIARSLSPRRQPTAPGMPGRSYTHYHGYRIPVSYLGALDLQAPHYNYATGHQYPISNYTVYGPPPKESRPMHKHKSRKSSNDDYVHDHSVFTSTIPAVTGYYIIHPDWVSERASMRRSKSLMAINAS